MAMFGRATRNDVLRSYTPTMAERIPIAVQGFLGRLGLNKYQARSFGQPIADVLGYSPVGAVAQSWDVGQSAARAPGMFGKVAGLGGGMALAALGAVPGGKALRGEVMPSLKSAIRVNGKVYSSVTDHLSALSQIPDDAVRARARMDGDNRGYITERGKWLDRFRAQEYAVANGLMSPDAPNWAKTSPDLISENLLRYDKQMERNAERLAALAPKPAPLAMDEASRMARAAADELPMDAMRRLNRARQMGFDTADNNLVHYTAKDFDGFSLNGDPSSHSGGGAVWLTNDPSLNMAAHQTKQSGELVEGSRGIPVYINKGKPMPIGTAMEMKRAGQLNENFPQLVSAEEGDLLRGLGYSHFERGPETVVFDPANIRSKFAAFDPAKRGSANLLAGLGVGAMVAPSMFGNRGGER